MAVGFHSFSFAENSMEILLFSFGPLVLRCSTGQCFISLSFLLYMLDIVECLEAGIYMIVHADDILVYVIDQNEDCARKKLHDTLARINTWCQANELSIEPAKCTAINFTCSRDPLNYFVNVVKIQSAD